MDYIIILACGFILGFIVGETLLAFKIQKVLSLKINDSSLPIINKKPHVFKLFIESDQGILYLYDHEKNEFVCQASTVDELAKLAKQYKNIEYAAVLHGDDALMFVNGTVKRENES